MAKKNAGVINERPLRLEFDKKMVLPSPIKTRYNYVSIMYQPLFKTFPTLVRSIRTLDFFPLFGTLFCVPFLKMSPKT